MQLTLYLNVKVVTTTFGKRINGGTLMNCALRVLPLVVVLAFSLPAKAQSYSDIILADRPFAYWRLDEAGSWSSRELGDQCVAESAEYVGDSEQLEFGVARVSLILTMQPFDS